MTMQSAPVQCPHCSSADSKRLISRFARVRSDDDALDAIADEVDSMGDSDDPRVMRRLMKEMSSAMGEDMDEDIEQMMEDDAHDGADSDSDGHESF